MKYQLTKKECFHACAYMTGRLLVETFNKKLLILILLCLLLMFILGGPVMGTILFLLIGGLLLLTYLISLCSTYQLNIRRGVLKESTLVLENGILISERDGSRLEFSASQISRVIQKKDSLLIILEERLGRGLYIILPKRIFSVPGDMDAFLKTLAEAAVKGTELKEPEDTEAVHEFSFFMDSDLFTHIQVLLSLEQAACQKYYRLRILIYTILEVGVGILLLRLIYGEKMSWLVLGVIAVAGLLGGIWAGSRKAIRKKVTRQTKMLLSKGKLNKMLGTWQMAFYENHMKIRFGGTENTLEYRSFQKFLESPDVYLFSGGLYGNSLGLPIQAVPPERRSEFLNFCRYRMPLEQTNGYKVKKRKLSGASRILLIFIAMIFLGAGITLGLHILEEGNRPKNYAGDGSAWEYDEDFIFRPEDYSDYTTIEDQISVLEELGFDIPEGAADYYHDWIDHSEYGKLYVEGYPYYVLLSDLGEPDYDMDTWQFLGYSGQVYWFDYEGWDISSDYIEILEGVQALTDEEVKFVGAREDCEDVNWRKETGTIRVTFWCGGRPHEFQANVDGDWLDPDFIPFLNEVLEQEGAKKRLYSCSDNGQGCILFYRDEAWAEEFTEKTGIVLSQEVR